MRLIRVIYLTLQLCLLVSAQTGDPLARKVDEFADVEASELIARLDSLAIELHNEPNARTFLVVYRTRRDLPGLSNRYAHRMKNYLVDSRGISANRVLTVDGGIASCLVQELWIVSPGGTPKPRADAHFSSYQPPAYKFDEHHYSSSQDPVDGTTYWREAPDDLLGYLEAFGLELQKNPKSIGYLIAYKRATSDRAAVSQNMLRTERNFLMKNLGIKPARIKTIDGGYRQWRTMELWIAQDSEGVPIITSYRFPSPRRRR